MFEVGFSELCMVALVALLVIGPERLPKVARVAGLWLGKARNMVASVKAEINAELQAEEMRQLFNEQASLNELQQLQTELNSATVNLKKSFDQPIEAAAKQVQGDETE